jgi:hypothetical protein
LYNGVSKQGCKHRSSLSYQDKRYELGVFNTAEEAAGAFDTKAKVINLEIKDDRLKLYTNFDSPLTETVKITQAREAWEAQQCARNAKLGIMGTTHPDCTNASGLFGVERNRQGSNKITWKAVMKSGAGQVLLGSYPTPEAAAEVYDLEVRKLPLSSLPLNFASEELAERAVNMAAAHLEKCGKKRPRPKSGFYGVTRTAGNKWVARIKVDASDITIGKFDTAEEAAAAYDSAVSCS